MFPFTWPFTPCFIPHLLLACCSLCFTTPLPPHPLPPHRLLFPRFPSFRFPKQIAAFARAPLTSPIHYGLLLTEVSPEVSPPTSLLTVPTLYPSRSNISTSRHQHLVPLLLPGLGPGAPSALGRRAAPVTPCTHKDSNSKRRRIQESWHLLSNSLIKDRTVTVMITNVFK